MHFFIVIFEQLIPISGGGTPRIFNIIKAINKRGHEVSIAASFNTDIKNVRKIFQSHNVFPLKLISRLDEYKIKKYLLFHPINIFKVIMSIIRTKPDIIIAHNSIAGISGLLSKKITGCKLVVDMTDLIFEYISYYSNENYFTKILLTIGRKIEKMVVKNADKIITMSQAMKEILYKIKHNNIDVVYDGVNTKIFNLIKKDGYTLKNQYAAGFKNVILFHGVIDPQDRPEIIVEAAKHVLIRNPSTMFWIVGDGAAVPVMKERISKNKMEKFFFFTGWVPYREVPIFISACDLGLVILPHTTSEEVRITLKTYEYWACEKPIIAAELKALKEVVTPWETGLFYKPGDPCDLAEKINTLLNNKDICIKMGKRGRRLVEKKYSWDALAMEFVLLCENMPAINSRKITQG